MTRARKALIVMVVAILVLASVRQLARSRDMQLFGRIIARVATNDPVVAITFDDGPVASKVDSILRILAERRVRATFFVTGAEMAASLEAGRKLVTAGHELGNHTYSHKRMVFKSAGFVRREVEDTDALIRAAGFKGPILFRAPYGFKLVGLPWFLRSTDRTSVTWDVEPDSHPEVAASAGGITRHVLERVRPGSIVLLHIWYASRRTSLEALPLIIDGLAARGYRFATVGELIGSSPPTPR